MTEVLDWHTAAHPRAIIRRAVKALTDGQLVAFPTETVYGLAASALVPEAVERLSQGKGRPQNKPLTLAVSGAAQALDWVPEMSPLGRRLARRCWPGPVTLVFGASAEQGLARRLPDSVRQRVCPTGTLGLRVPAHNAILQALRRLPGPLVLTSANRSGEPAATSAEQVLQALGNEVAFVINDGPSRYGNASTVVQVNGNRWQVLRVGVVSPAELERHATCIILFVCTGNTCRSPLAEALCKKLLAERLGCRPEELPQHGFVVLSAGLTAMMGAGAASEAMAVARELGADLSQHSSQTLTPMLAAQADYLMAMTRSHLGTLNSHFGRLGSRPRLLSPDGEDVADPIGSDHQVYRDCAHQIRRYLEKWVAELQQ